METCFYQETTEYDQNEFRKYFEYKNKPLLTKKLFLCYAIIFFVSIVLLVLFSGQYLIVCVAAGLIVLDLATKYLLRRLQYRRQYKAMYGLWDQSYEICLYETYASMRTAETAIQYEYDQFYRMEESNSRFYLIAGPRQIVIIKKPACAPEVQEALRELTPTGHKPSAITNDQATQNFLKDVVQKKR